MGFRSVCELHDGRTGGLSEGLERRYTRRFRVRTDSKSVGPIEVMFAPGVPRLYDPYQSYGTNEFDSFALCRRVTPTQDADDWFTWVVECEYDTTGGNPQGQPENPGQPGTGGGSGAAGDPTLEPQTVEWGTQSREVALIEDLGDPDSNDPIIKNPRPILNSAGQPFDPVPTIEQAHLTLTIERNEVEFDVGKATKYRNVVNKDMWLDRIPGRWLCRQITGRVVYKGAYQYARVRYEFWLSPTIRARDFWDNLELLDQGLCRLDADGERPVPIIRNGHPISQPALLKDGAPLTRAQIRNPNVGPQYLRFKRYRREPFAPLKITI